MKQSCFLAVASIEFTVVVFLLFLIFIFSIDIAIFIKQPYALQSFSDALMVKLENSASCLDEDVVSSQIQKEVQYHYGYFQDFTKTEDNNVVTYNGGRFSILIKCRNNSTPEKLIVNYTYNGIFLFKHHVFVSQPVNNTTVYY